MIEFVTHVQQTIDKYIYTDYIKQYINNLTISSKYNLLYILIQEIIYFFLKSLFILNYVCFMHTSLNYLCTQ